MGNVTIKQLKEKLKSIENINEVRPNNKYSMFHLLVRYGQDPRMIDYLISAGVDYTLETKLGGKALHYVVERKDQAYEFTKKLIAYDKDIDAKDHYYDSTPLIWATSSRAPVSVIKLLLDNKADANIKNNKGNTALIATTKSNPTNEKGFFIDPENCSDFIG